MSKFHEIRSAIRLMGVAAVSLLVVFAASAQTVRYIHTDGLGSVVMVTDKDRNVVERSEYEPYGSLLNRPVTDGPGYTGHVMDASTGLTYMQQRYYDQSIGRFLSVDPVTAEVKTGGNFNRYWYAGNNPYKYTDPNGRCFWDGCVGEAIIAGFVIGAVVDVVAQKIMDPHGDINVPSAIISGVAGAVTGGTGAALTGATARGSITVTQAVIRQAGIGAAAGAASNVAGDVADGKTPTVQRMTNAAGASALGSLAGSAVSALAGASSRTTSGTLARMANASPTSPAGIGNHIASATMAAGPVRAATTVQSLFSQATKLTDTTAAVTEKKLNKEP
ncbi:RHS repeat-associated core domain-containing protein [Xanthomonas albilineans]|uniref:Teneurin-like YD-shell domain-containing protein n=1 Tax=Xanthomonas albilineans (strain GPE PC73 / CFBP 7063) TaxID=380358 RepID=D2U977_XANAP|nr:RHS repeat-associated core domain-containing protein [Xanthomonas albilineans]CBA16819.1 hypothetical protein XALC_2339 [Xanthomonas albilineans GPE PC73]